MATRRSRKPSKNVIELSSEEDSEDLEVMGSSEEEDADVVCAIDREERGHADAPQATPAGAAAAHAPTADSRRAPHCTKHCTNARTCRRRKSSF